MRDFFDNVAVAMTVCDLEGRVVYQNNRAIEALGDAREHNLKECHKNSSWEKIQEMIAQGSTNAYTIDMGEYSYIGTSLLSAAAIATPCA